MISAIITSYKEPRTIPLAIFSLQKQLSSKDEIIVIAPDVETREAAQSCASKSKVPLRVLKDAGKGKPAALNTAVKAAKGHFLLLTDGDVKINEFAVSLLEKAMSKYKADAVTGRVVSANTRNNMLGFWSHYTTLAFHFLRLEEMKNKEPIVCTGYLYLVKKKFMPHVPKETLADDAYVSYSILSKSGKIVYEPRAQVLVRYPTNLKDWLKQKKRTAGRVYQLTENFGVSKTGSLIDEMRSALRTLETVRSFKEFIWMFCLYGMKIYVWLHVFFNTNLKTGSLKKIWVRIESTK